MEKSVVEGLHGGKGHVILEHLPGAEARGPHCGLYAQVTLEPGCEIGWHIHLGESETYYLLSGEGDYNDNGEIRPVKAGDVTVTASGMGHGLLNTGSAPLVMMALIVKE